MTDVSEMKIVVNRNGPYRVVGGIPLAIETITPNPAGESWEWTPGRSFEASAEYFLCRCGHSKNKPFCDNSHLSVGFEGKETASRRPIERQSEHFDGPTHVLSDDEELCAFARFCDPGGKIWSLIEQTDRPEVRELVVREAFHCPSGRLVLREKSTGKVLEPTLPPSIGIVEDTALKCSGPLWVRGGDPSGVRGRPAVRDPEPGHALPVRCVDEHAVLQRQPRLDPIPRRAYAREQSLNGRRHRPRFPRTRPPRPKRPTAPRCGGRVGRSPRMEQPGERARGSAPSGRSRPSSSSAGP